MAMTIVVVSSLVGIVGLLIGAFTTIPDPKEAVVQCVTTEESVAGETIQTLLVFAFGFLSMLAAKHRNDLARQVDKALCSINSMVSSAVACLASAVARLTLPQLPRLNKSSMAIIVAATLCSLCIMSLLISAFAAEPDADPRSGGFASESSSVAGETTKTLLIFTFGYLSTLAARHRNDLARQVDKAICSINSMVSSAVACVAPAVADARANRLILPQLPWLNKSSMAIIVAATVCSVCIMSLLISAFAAEPDTEPTSAGFASESSTGMKVFTMGWMVILSFKLRRELIGLVGSSCLFQPW